MCARIRGYVGRYSSETSGDIVSIQLRTGSFKSFALHELISLYYFLCICVFTDANALSKTRADSFRFSLGRALLPFQKAFALGRVISSRLSLPGVVSIA
jgi:hypothetical protein